MGVKVAAGELPDEMFADVELKNPNVVSVKKWNSFI